MTKIIQRKYKKDYAKVLVNIAAGDLRTVNKKHTPPFGYDLRELNQFATNRRYEEGHYTLTDEEILAAVDGAEEVLKWAQLIVLG